MVASALATGASALIPARARATPRLVLNDASRLDPTPVTKHIIRGAEPEAQLLSAIRAELKEAAAAKRPVALGAARHSMGGQSLPRDGTAITLDSRRIELDSAGKLYRVDAGARWADVIKVLDPAGFSPVVMQSNNDFGVAATFCVNAHGWPVSHGPFGSTVRSLRMILADGSLVRCSRTENADLFAHAMGGYGLFGIIIDLEVEMTPNLVLVPTAARMPADEFGPRFVASLAADPTIQMAYGRMSLTRKDFLGEALLTVYHPQPGPSAQIPPARDHTVLTTLLNRIYRAQIGSEAMKALRWQMETRLNPLLSSGPVTRNALLNEPVSNLFNNDPRRTDILHEYFVPPHRFADFLAGCREVIPRAKAEFINVTLRYVDTDRMAKMSFAPTPRVSAVMSFSQEMTTAGEVDMMVMTERLIDNVLAVGGTFYLPYRLHARRDQVERAYPGSSAFVASKRACDPGLLFRNAMWTAYFE
jgi:FAD/FMN-containing dehydrogenase